MIRPIDGFNGYYVSDDGRIFSDIMMGGKRQHDKEMHEVKGRPNQRSGYCRVCMRRGTDGRFESCIHGIV